MVHPEVPRELELEMPVLKAFGNRIRKKEDFGSKQKGPAEQVAPRRPIRSRALLFTPEDWSGSVRATSFREEKGTQTQTFWSGFPRLVGGGLPREGVRAKKFGMFLPHSHCASQGNELLQSMPC